MPKPPLEDPANDAPEAPRSPGGGPDQPAHYCGRKGKSGPKKGSKNALRTGASIDRRRLTVGELPRKMISVRREALAYRRELEAEVMAAKGAISFADAHLIDSASAATMVAGICRWRLRHKLEDMSGKDVEASGMNILKAKGIRNSLIKQLKLDARPADPWDVVDAEVVDA